MCLSKRNEGIWPRKDLYESVYSGFIQHSEKLGTAQCSSVGRWINQPHWYLTILPKQKKRADDYCTQPQDQSQTHHAAWEKLQVKRKHTVWFLLNEVLKQTKLIYSATNVIIVAAFRHGEGGNDWEEAWPLSGVLVMLYILIGVWEHRCVNETGPSWTKLPCWLVCGLKPPWAEFSLPHSFLLFNHILKYSLVA